VKCTPELAGWLCQSQTGASLHARLAASSHSDACPLCGDPLSSTNDDLPCLHWLANPYSKPARMAAVFANYAVADVVRYMLVWTMSSTRRDPARHLHCTLHDGSVDILIGFRNRSWRFLLDAAGGAGFEYASARTGFAFRLPLSLQHGDAAALQQLALLAALAPISCTEIQQHCSTV
jgi:hypothetical protein